MPIYEYVCPECNTDFEVMLSFSEADKTVLCPKCKFPAKRVISNFASKTGSYLQAPTKSFRKEVVQK